MLELLKASHGMKQDFDCENVTRQINCLSKVES